MFGGGGQRAQRKRKVKPTVKELNVTLEDVYNGKMVQLKNRRTALCEDCHGKGGEGVQRCGECKGQGAVFRTVMMGPGQYAKMQTTCNDCRGQGEVRISFCNFQNF